MLKRSFNPDSRLPRQSGGQVSGRKIILLLLIGLFISTFAFADYRITRGPDIGEIYFIGPTATGEGIYYSTDFGETAVCVDSISEVISICADLTSGSIYRGRMPNCLYYSNNHGQYGSWVFRTAEGADEIESGRNEGEIFKGPGMSSNDYGYSFTQHSLNGCFCSIKTFEIGNQDSVGYLLGNVYGIIDTLWLLISYDNFENVEVQHVFNFNAPKVFLSRGYEEGEIYLYTYYWGIGDGRKLRFSNDYGQDWELKNEFNCPNLPIRSIVGGRQPGELYMVVEYIQLMWQIAHTYIYHSLDYGETFTVYHPFSHGPEPYIANFEATPTEGTAPLTVQFTDLSSGENLNYWEWDFNNDGVIDSYEQNPEYTYQDTGYFSVSLTVHPLDLNTATRYDYIHVTENNACGDELIHISEIELSNSPNPFNPETTISYDLPINVENPVIEIFNVKGKKVKTFNVTLSPESSLGKGSVVWDGKDNYQNQVASGVYLYRVKSDDFVSKTKRMLLLK